MSATPLSLATCTVETFRPQLDTRFDLTAPTGEQVALRLVQAVAAHPSPAPSASGSREPFSLLLVGPARPLLPQSTYPLEHEALGDLELFLVPVARGADGASYEAVFA